jgi:sugar lactone lactonase YvrE
VWETPDVFKIPESVVYDEARDVLYVTSYDKIEPGHFETGFISRVQPDGRIKDLHWVTGLDGPCGMTISGDRLFVVEAPRRTLVEIDIESGTILKRYPTQGTRFLNDVVADESGNIYITNSTRASAESDIFKCKNGQCEMWKDGHELHGANGVFIQGDELLVGSSGNGFLKAVSLKDGRTRNIVCLGAGVIDGIRIDNKGNYLVSHWEGKAYIVSPSGEVTEILDARDAGLNLADFEFIQQQNLLIIPTFLGNRVCAYRLVTD